MLIKILIISAVGLIIINFLDKLKEVVIKEINNNRKKK